MFYAIAQVKDENGSYPMSLRMHGYKSLDSARKALDKSKWVGFVKKYGEDRPVYFKVS